MISALVNKDTLVVENIIVADPSVDPPIEGYMLIDIDNFVCGIGWKYDPVMIDFINPNPEPVPNPNPIQDQQPE